MKLRRQLTTTKKLSSAARDLLVFMARTCRLPLLAVVAKCRELWEGIIITRRGERRARPADDDYFRWSYEFSCTTTPVNALPVKGRRRPRRLLPPCCVGGRRAREMTLASVAPKDNECRSPGPGAAGGQHEIDDLAEEFINRFREQLRMQGVAMQREDDEAALSRLARPAPVA